MPSLEELIGKIMSMAEASQKARGIDNFGSVGFVNNQERAYQDSRNDARAKMIMERDKQRDVVSEGRYGRENAMSLAGMQYGPGGSVDRTNQRYVDAANIGLKGHQYTADKNLEGHQMQADAQRYGQDKTLEGQAMQFGPGGATDRRDALQYQKLTPEAQRLQHASDIAGRLAATGAPPDQVKALYESLSSRPADFSELNPNRQQSGAGQTAAPYVFRDGSVEKTAADQNPPPPQLPLMASAHTPTGGYTQRDFPTPPLVELANRIPGMVKDKFTAIGSVEPDYSLNSPGLGFQVPKKKKLQQVNY